MHQEQGSDPNASRHAEVRREQENSSLICSDSSHEFAWLSQSRSISSVSKSFMPASFWTRKALEGSCLVMQPGR